MGASVDGVWVGTIVGTAVGVSEGAPVGLRGGVAVGKGVKSFGRHVCCWDDEFDHGSCCQAENWPPTNGENVDCAPPSPKGKKPRPR